MLKLFKSSLLLLFIINLTACSYSPESLKENYNEMASEFSTSLQEPYDLSNKQRAMIDEYSKQFFQWHRHNKLPAYSRNFAILAEQTQQQNPDLSSLVKVFTDIEKFPHIYQATHLTPKMVAFAKTLDSGQINQLNEYLNNENKLSILEIKKTPYADDLNQGVKATFKFLEIPLNIKQLKSVNKYTPKFQDNRIREVQVTKAWGQKVISLLKNKNSSNFDNRLADLWNKQDSLLSGRALEIQNRNILLEAKLMKALVLSFTPEQRNQLTKQLFSISSTMSEMANE